MAWQWLIRGWLAGQAKQELFARAEELLRERMRNQPATPADTEAAQALRAPCSAGLIFSANAEAAGIVDRLIDSLTVHADGLDIQLGRLEERNVALVTAGTSREQVAKAAESLIRGHRPGLVIIAGFATPLSPGLPCGQVVVASSVLEECDGEVSEFSTALGESAVGGAGPAAVTRPGVQVGRIVTLADPPRSVESLDALGRRLNAVAVEPISAAAAKVCQQSHAPWLAVYALRDRAAQEASPEVRNYRRQTSLAGKLGAALGAVTKRPGIVKEMLKSAEETLTAGDRLAEVLSELIKLIP